MNPLALVTRGYLCPAPGAGLITGTAPEVSGQRDVPFVLVEEISAPRVIGKAKPLPKPVIKPKKRK